MSKTKNFYRPKFTAKFEIREEGFSFTGNISGSSGACGDEIAKAAPIFEPLNDLHLCDINGRPLYYLENAFYHFKESKYDIDKLFGYWNLKPKDFPKMKRDVSAGVTILKNKLAKMEGASQEEIEKEHEKGDKALKAHILKNIEKHLFTVWQERADRIEKVLASIPERLEKENETFEPEDCLPKKLALAQFLACHPEDIETSSYNDNCLSGEGSEYLVVTDEEAEDLWEECLENYIDDCIFTDLPEIAQRYFDHDKWKRDARFDGRGHSLSSYDGEEHEEEIDGETFYIYKN